MSVRPGPYGVDRLDLMVDDLCGRCDRPRLALNGRPLAIGAECVSCKSLSIRVPRKPGQIEGDLVIPQHPNGGTE